MSATSQQCDGVKTVPFEKLASRFSLPLFLTWVLEQASGDGYPLFLSPAKLEASLSDHGFPPFRLRFDEIEYVRLPRRLLELRLAGVPVPVSDVVADSVVEERGVLRYHADYLPEAFLLRLLDVDPIDDDPSPSNVVKP